MDKLLQFDRDLFWLINVKGSQPMLDWLMPIITNLHNRWWFAWLVLPCLFFSWWKVDRIRAGRGMLAIIVSVCLSDALCHRYIKPAVGRPRPDPSVENMVARVPINGLYSWPSNHAANSFAAATSLSLILGRWHRGAWLLALLISFSRVYLGVHYPLDVLGGAVIGFLVALGVHHCLELLWMIRARQRA